MAYFPENEPQTPYEEDVYDEASWQEPEADEAAVSDAVLEEIDLEERREKRRARWELMAGFGNFFGIIAGVAVILVLIALLVSLINWLRGDLNQTFLLIQRAG